MTMTRKAWESHLDRYDPAASVVAAFGGPSTLGRMLGIAASSVFRWTLARPQRPEMSGRIPPRHHERIAALAAARGLSIDLDGPPAKLAEFPAAVRPKRGRS